jgi:hypothetical protein
MGYINLGERGIFGNATAVALGVYGAAAGGDCAAHVAREVDVVDAVSAQKWRVWHGRQVFAVEFTAQAGYSQRRFLSCVCLFQRFYSVFLLSFCA